MDDEDVCIAVRKTGNIEEMDMVLCQRHDGVVTLCSEAWFSDIGPRNGRRVRHCHGTHIQEEQLAL